AIMLAGAQRYGAGGLTAIAVSAEAIIRAQDPSSASGVSGKGQRPISETDLFKFTWVADPQISPDGSSVAFVRVVVNEKENRYETSIFVVPASGNEPPRGLPSGIRDTARGWAPDGKRLVFVRSIDKDGKPQPGQIYLLRTDGGEARAITDLPQGASAPTWSYDGK